MENAQEDLWWLCRLEVGGKLLGWEMFPKWQSIKIIWDRGLTVWVFSNDPAVAWGAVGKVQCLVGCSVAVVSHLFPSHRAERALMTESPNDAFRDAWGVAQLLQQGEAWFPQSEFQWCVEEPGHAWKGLSAPPHHSRAVRQLAAASCTWPGVERELQLHCLTQSWKSFGLCCKGVRNVSYCSAVTLHHKGLPGKASVRGTCVSWWALPVLLLPHLSDINFPELLQPYVTAPAPLAAFSGGERCWFTLHTGAAAQLCLHLSGQAAPLWSRGREK